MSRHHPLCPFDEPPKVAVLACLCPLIARVEADERERIAQAIEAEGHPLGCSSRWGGHSCDCAVGRHAAIARGGGGDG